MTFHGVRGSTPCDGESIARYGGNTSCVSLSIPGHDPLLFDLGTGLRYFGCAQHADRPFRGHCLLSHLHWDHLQGLPFFTPLLREGGAMTIYAPVQEDGRTPREVIDGCLCPPLFPIGLDDLAGRVEFRAIGDDEFQIGEITVTSRLIPHIGSTCGFRVEWGGQSVAYLSDHQQPGIDVYEATAGARELCRGADLLIHDAQYTPEEFAAKSDWGHCTIEYAVWLAIECGVRTLALFHHDPLHDDDTLDRLVAAAAEVGGAHGVRVVGASEGMTIRVGR